MSKETFSLLYPPVYCFIQNYAESYIASWKLKEYLEDYGDFNDALINQLDYISSIGGASAPVSYTHLDVYKRQVIMGCARGGRDEKPLDYEYWKKVGNEITNHNKNYQK